MRICHETKHWKIIDIISLKISIILSVIEFLLRNLRKAKGIFFLKFSFIMFNHNFFFSRAVLFASTCTSLCKLSSKMRWMPECILVLVVIINFNKKFQAKILYVFSSFSKTRFFFPFRMVIKINQQVNKKYHTQMKKNFCNTFFFVVKIIWTFFLSYAFAFRILNICGFMFHILW